MKWDVLHKRSFRFSSILEYFESFCCYRCTYLVSHMDPVQFSGYWLSCRVHWASYAHHWFNSAVIVRIDWMLALAASPQIFMQWICEHCFNLANHPLLAVNVLFPPPPFPPPQSKRLLAFAVLSHWVRGILFWFKLSTPSVSNCSVFFYVKISSVTYIWCM